MGWNGVAPSQTFGRTNGVNTGATTWQTDAAASTNILSTRHDTHDQDVADGVNACLKKDGGNTATADIPMGAFKFSNAGDATGLQNYLTLKQKLNGVGEYVATVTGTANAIILTTGFSLTSYVAGMRFTFIPTSTNSSTATVNVDGIGVKNITGPAAATLAAGQLLLNKATTIVYDGTQFQVDTIAPVALSVGMIAAFPGATVPTGWLECYGQAISRTTYSDLFSIISTTYGVGDGSSTFNLPDLRGRSIFGEDDMGGTAASRITNSGSSIVGATLGATGGAETVTIAQANLPDVTFPNTLDIGNKTQVARGGSETNVDTFGATTPVSKLGGTASSTLSITGGVTSGGSGTALNKMPPTIIFKWLILALPASTLPSIGGVVTPTGGVAAAGGYSIAPRNWHTGGVPATQTTDGNDTTPSTTETYIAEIFVPANATVTGIGFFNGSAVAGNIKGIIYDSTGVVVAECTSTASSGTDTYQRIPLTATYAIKGPATYYIGLQCNNASYRFNSHILGNFGASKKTGETYGTSTTITPPTTFTTALGPIATLY